MKLIRAVDLSERFDVSERTIYRDMRALLEMGVPLVTLPGEGYRLMDTFRLPPVMLTIEETTALFLAGQMLMHIGEGKIAVHAETALQKVMSVLPPNEKEQALHMARVIDFLPPQTRLNWDEPYLMSIIDAIASQRILHLTYRSYKASDETERDIEPTRLMFADGAWYLNGYCRLRSDMRAFRLNRITSLSVKPETFIPRIIVPKQMKSFQVTVRFNEQIQPHVREQQHYAFVSEDEDTFIYQVHTLEEIQNWLLGFGSNAQVLSPDTLRDWMREEAKRLINLLT